MKKMEQKSRSQIKREMLSLQKLGERLVELSPDMLSEIEMPDQLRNAVIEAKAIKKHEALRRQMQFIGSLMRKADSTTIRDALDKIAKGRKREAAAFKRLEALRDRLIGQDEELLNKTLEQFADADRRTLTQLVRNAKKEEIRGDSKKAYRSLFRYLRGLTHKK